MKKMRKAILFILMIFLLTGCGSNLFIEAEKDAQGVIKLGEDFITVNVVRWKVKEDRIKIMTTEGEIYDVLYKDVALVDKGN